MSFDDKMTSVPKHLDHSRLTGVLALLGTLAAAFALRVYALAAQSLWNDEGTSIALAARSLEAIAVGAAQDIHPPLYYFLLHFWMPLAGESEYAVRFLSVAAGALLVAFSMRLARDLFGREVALIAALLSALSPFQIYYSQETRMYIWVALWSVMSVWAMVTATRVIAKSPASRAERSAVEGAGRRSNLRQWWGLLWRQGPPPRNDIDSRRATAWLLYIGATVAALYTHYFAPAVVVAENLGFAVWLVVTWRLVPRDPSAVGGSRSSVERAMAWWVAAQVLIALAFLPWYLYAGNQLAAWPSVSEPFDLPTLVWRVLNIFATGLSLDGPAATITALVLGVLLVFGLLPARDRWAGWGGPLLGFWLVVPVGVMYVVSLSRPAYNPKFLLLAAPPFLILAARGLSCLPARVFQQGLRRDRLGPASLFSVLGVAILAVVGFLPSLRNYYSDARYARDDYRAILQYVDANAQPGDGILVDAPGQADVVRYYHRGDQPLFLLPIGRPPDPGATRAKVDEMLDRVQRLYAIYWATEQADPEGIVESRLAEQAFKARDEWHGNVRLAVYGVAPPARLAPQAIDAEFGGEIRLTRYQLDTQQARAGGMLMLTFEWQAEQTPSARYKVFVHLLDAENRIVAQRDGEPVADLRLTTTWRAGEIIADNFGVLITPDTPPGEYRIEVGMYRAEGGARLPIRGKEGQAVGDHIILRGVRVYQ